MLMISVKVLQQVVISILFAFIIAGCSTKSPVVKSSVPSPPLKSYPEKTISQLGAEMQQGGIMSQKDYIRIVNLGHKVMRTHNISDEDFAWTLSFLKTSRNQIARARAMIVLSLIQPMSSEQKAKVTLAIAPYIKEEGSLDGDSARTLQRSMQRY